MCFCFCFEFNPTQTKVCATVSRIVTYYTRNLPHWQPDGRDIFITWRLSGSLPAQFKLPTRGATAGEQFLDYDRMLDTAGAGPMWLKDPRVAHALLAALQKCQARGIFRLHSYVVMCNHVHVLIEPKAPLAKITRAIKGATAREANLMLDRMGQRFWQDESFDHWIRDGAEFERVRQYIEWNPVAAKLAARPENWRWSSAHPYVKRLIEQIAGTAQAACGPATPA